MVQLKNSYKLLWIFISIVVCQTFESFENHEIPYSQILQSDIFDEIDTQSTLWSLQSHSVAINFDGSKWIAELVCTFPYQQIAEITWHLQGRRISDSDPDSKYSIINNYMGLNSSDEIVSTLRIDNFTYDDVDQYTCLLASPEGYINSTMWVVHRPNISNVDTLIEVEDGETVEVSCSSVTKTPLYWWLPGFSETYGPDVTSEDDGFYSTTNISFTASKYHTSPHYWCCMSMDRFGLPPQCTNFKVAVESDPILSIEVGCFQKTNNCFVNCSSYAYPSVSTLALVHDPPSLNGTCFNVTHSYPFGDLLQQYYVTSYLSPTQFYCNSTNGDRSSLTEIITIDDSILAYPLPPILIRNPGISMRYSSSGVSALFVCSFNNNNNYYQNVSVFWLKISLHQSSEGIEMIKIENTSDYTIGVTPIRQSVVLTYLRIPNYDNHNNEIFICGARNDYGWNTSSLLIARQRIRNVKITSTQTHYSPEDQVTVTCSATGYPPPVLVWTVMSEFDVTYSNVTSYDYKSQTATSTLQFQADTKNAFVSIKCTGYDGFWRYRFRSVNTIIRINIPSTLELTSTCTSDSFTDNQPCTLRCDSQSNNASDLRTSGWIYYIDTPTSNVSLEDATASRITPFRYQLSATLTNYSSGYYQCWSQYSNDAVKTQDVRIGSDPEIALQDFCDSSSQCASLYATCDVACQCLAPHNIPLDASSMTLECLMPALPDQNCFNNEQCQAGENNYICKQQSQTQALCICNGTLRTVDDDTVKCLQPAVYGQSCIYVEECVLADPLSDCRNGKCGCTDGSKYDSYVKKCTYDDSGSGQLSVAAIIVIIVACFLLIGLCTAYFTGIVRKRRQQPHRSNSTNIDMTYHNEDDDVPYSQFANESNSSFGNIDDSSSVQSSTA